MMHMDFIEFRDLLQERFKEMSSRKMFVADVNKDEMWNHYLDSFIDGSNPIYRVRTEHDCSLCRNFIKNIGAVVVINNGAIGTIWDFSISNQAYQAVAVAMGEYVRSKPIANVFIAEQKKYGALSTFEMENENVVQYDHFEVEVPQKFLAKKSVSSDSERGQFRDNVSVFLRSLSELSKDSIVAVLELISQNSLYRGEEWKPVLNKFLEYKIKYDKLYGEDKKGLFAWEHAATAGVVVGRIRNHSIGTLLTDISCGEDLDSAVRKYEAIVAPTNYKRPKAIYTQKMLDKAKAEISALGYMDSIGRRHANLYDISVQNILFCNRDVTKRVTGAEDIFSEMEKNVKTNPKKFSSVEEIGIDKFVSDVLPSVREMELYFEGRHAQNMVSLIAPAVKEAKSMFKWGNAFSWAYSGNLTDSIKENVKSAGGSVTGDLRFSIQWNDKVKSSDDLDAHCNEPRGRSTIYFGNKISNISGGVLDVDIIHPAPGVPAVENITWKSRSSMPTGKYEFSVNLFNDRGGHGGFQAEIEFDDNIYSYSYPNVMVAKEHVKVADVTLNKDGSFTIEEHLTSGAFSKEIWGIPTNRFVPVSVVMLSPNYWDNQHGVGNRHYFFMLKNCENPETPNGFYNEFLKPELEKHKHVFEALGAKAKTARTEDQLSGIGISSTKRENLVVKVKGQTERVLKIVF